MENKSSVTKNSKKKTILSPHKKDPDKNFEDYIDNFFSESFIDNILPVEKK